MKNYKNFHTIYLFVFMADTYITKYKLKTVFSLSKKTCLTFTVNKTKYRTVLSLFKKFQTFHFSADIIYRYLRKNIKI